MPSRRSSRWPRSSSSTRRISARSTRSADARRPRPGLDEHPAIHRRWPRGDAHLAAPGQPAAAQPQGEAFTRARDTAPPHRLEPLRRRPPPRASSSVYVPVVARWRRALRPGGGLPAASFGEVLRAQQFGPGAVAVLQDRDNVIIARTQGEAELVGRRARTPAAGREGWTRSRLNEGVDVYVAFATAPLSGWRVVLTTPAAADRRPAAARRSGSCSAAPRWPPASPACWPSASAGGSRPRWARSCASPARSSAAIRPSRS